MSYTREELSKYRIDRSLESLEEAKILSVTGHWNTVANRLYYSCFYAASAYLIKNDFEASTHVGVKRLFNKELIKSNALSTSEGQLYNKLFNLRQDADYRDFADLSEDEIKPMILMVENLIHQIIQIINPHS